MFNSLLDTDLYKLTMQQAVFHHFPETQVKYKFICRSKDVDLRKYIRAINEQIDEYCSLRFAQHEMDYLRTLPYFKPGYLSYLENYKPNRNCVLVYEGEKNLEIRIKGSWLETILFEVPILAIVSETYCTSVLSPIKASLFGHKKLNEKIDLIKEYNSNSLKKLNIADFGTRRRYSSSWHDRVVERLKPLLSGTSNLYLAKKYGITAIGTVAHEWYQAGMGLTVLSNSQRFMLEKWAQEYRGQLGQLGIALTDTIGVDSFLKDLDPYLARLYDGVRQDSGDPFAWGDKIIAHYEKLGLDPLTKRAVFTDGLDIPKAIEIAKKFGDRIQVSFGIGTNLSNSVGMTPLSIVIKLVMVNDNFVAKISDEPEKTTCEDEQFLSYLKKVYRLPV